MSQLWLKTWKSLLIEWCWLPVVLIFTPCLQVWKVLVMVCFKCIHFWAFFSFINIFYEIKHCNGGKCSLFQIPLHLCFSFLQSCCGCVYIAYIYSQIYAQLPPSTFIFIFIVLVYLPVICNSFWCFIILAKEKCFY